MKPSVELEGIGQVLVTVRDLERAVAFYRDVLELRLLFEVPEQRMAFFECGGVRLYLGEPEGNGPESHPLLYFRVAAIGAAWELLTGRGVETLRPPREVHRSGERALWLAFFRDGEGNTLALMEERPVQAS